MNYLLILIWQALPATKATTATTTTQGKYSRTHKERLTPPGRQMCINLNIVLSNLIRQMNSKWTILVIYFLFLGISQCSMSFVNVFELETKHKNTIFDMNTQVHIISSYVYFNSWQSMSFTVFMYSTKSRPGKV